ncbi:MAG: Gfo/Idh/MocA family protein [Christensenellales bacterium]|jgi:predicted dehydrogenase
MRFAVIGRGMIVEKWLDAVRTLPGFELAAVYSRSLDAARAFALKHGAARYMDSLDRLADDPGVDAVYIASPNLFHARQAIQMLEAGKHVLVEKPMCVDAGEAADMFRAADSSGCLLLEATRNVLNPAMDILYKALPKLGPIRFAQFHYCQYSSRYDRFKRGVMTNAFDPSLATGGLMDLGIYCMEAAAYLFGETSRVTGVNHALKHGWDALGTVVLSYSDMQSVLHYSKITDGKTPSEIQGENAVLLIDHIAHLRSACILYRDGSEETLFTESSLNDLRHETSAFIDMVNGRISAERYRACSLASMRMMDLARAAMGIRFHEQA